MPYVITAQPATTQLCTLDAVKDELRITDASDNRYLTKQIDVASAMVAKYCNRQLASVALTETFRLTRIGGSFVDPAWNVGGGTPRLLGAAVLEIWPLTAISAITHGDASLDCSQSGGLVSTDYEIDTNTGELIRLINDSPSGWSARKLVVSYTAGYKLPNDMGRTLPFDIERAAVVTVSDLYNARGRDSTLRSTSIVDVGADAFRDPQPGLGGLSQQVASLLEPYRRINVV